MHFLTKLLATSALAATTASAWQFSFYQSADCTPDGVNYMTYRGSGNDCHIMGKSDATAQCYYLLNGGHEQADCSTEAWANDFAIPGRGNVFVPKGAKCSIWFQEDESSPCYSANKYDFDGSEDAVCLSEQFLLHEPFTTLSYQCEDV